MTGKSAEIPTAIQNRCLIACLRKSLSWSMVAVALGFNSTRGFAGGGVFRSDHLAGTAGGGAVAGPGGAPGAGGAAVLL